MKKQTKPKTPKQEVLELFPSAVAIKDFPSLMMCDVMWRIKVNGRDIGVGRKQSDAWSNASINITSKQPPPTS